MARAATSPKPFICDVPAKMLKRSKDLSKGARMLHGTMRGLANGRTGELAIRGNPLDWKFIAREAEIGRDQWQRLLRELLASGYVTRERERAEHYKSGRKRIVLGRARYFVHKQPKRAKKPSILLMPDSPTVEESGTQVFSETPYRAERSASPVCELKTVEKKNHQSSSGSPATPDDDDDSRACSLESNPFLPDETKILMDRIRRRLRERWPQLFEPYKKQLQDDDFLSSAIQMIGERGEEQIVNPIAYFTTALIEILLTADGPDPETFDDDFGWLVQKAENKRDLREWFMPGFTGPTLQTEEHRRAFVAMNCAEVGEVDSESTVLAPTALENKSVTRVLATCVNGQSAKVPR
jgi:hypothetical protein